MITVPTDSFDQKDRITTPNKKTKFTIASHNIRSLNESTKQNILFSLYDTHNYDILALQETNFNFNNSPFFNRSFSTFFTLFSKNCDSQSSGFGVSLSFSPLLSKHIFQHNSFLDRIIYAKLQFPDKQKLLVVNAYLPPRKTKSSTIIQVVNQVKLLLDEAVKNDYHIILM